MKAEAEKAEGGNVAGTLEKRIYGKPKKCVVLTKEVKGTPNSWIKECAKN